MSGHRRVYFLLSAIVILLLVLVPAAMAGKFHFNSIIFTLGSSLDLNGVLVGLGNEVAEVELTAYGSVTAMCQNRGGNQAPGRNPIAVEVVETVVATTGANGRALVFIEASDPTAPGFEPSPTPKEAGCPNGNWKVVDIIDGSTDWTAARVVVRDEAGVVQIDESFTCTTSFTGGVATSVTCVQD